jgi:hypothetical protein
MNKGKDEVKLFETIRAWFNPTQIHRAPQYGRGTHALPNPKEKELFERASEAFVQGNILNGYEFFLSSLNHQDNLFSIPHLSIERSAESIHFTLYQGYALVRGTVTATSL